MTLPAPRLDDRRFQDIVDDAKRRIHRLCPEWTDHNVSDPGVAMIELFAWMTEMILYRLNQVPDRLYLKFLELMGVELAGSTAAQTVLMFHLTAPRPEPVRIPARTQVSTERIGDEEPAVFMTGQDLTVTPPHLTHCVTRTGQHYTDRTDDLVLGIQPVECFGSLTPGDAVYFGFAEGLAANIVRLTVVTGAEGAGIDPDRPPLRWQSWTGRGWKSAVVLDDTTDALNAVAGGEITLLLAPEHEPLAIGQTRAHWIRCRLIEPPQDAPTYKRSPVLQSLSVVSLGGAVPARHAEPAPAELLGLSSGEPGQTFRVGRTPVLAREPGETVRVIAPRPDGTGAVEEQDWTEVEHFGLAEEGDRVFTWSDTTGEIRFGPQIRDVDGRIVVTGYRHGGGAPGNVGPHRLTVLRTSIPFVAKVTNLTGASGGVDAETIDNVKHRGPMTIRSGDRAVTVDDFERLTLSSTSLVGRARCLPPDADGPVRVLVVPRVQVAPQALGLTDLVLPEELVEEVTGYLDRRRLLTTRVQVETPRYQGLMVVAQIRAVVGMRAETVREACVEELYRFVNPLTGGPERTGWPFGQALNDGDIHALLRGVAGVGTVARVYFFLADLRTQKVEDTELQRVSLPADAVFMSHRHQVVVS